MPDTAHALLINPDPSALADHPDLPLPRTPNRPPPTCSPPSVPTRNN
ncbi:hypothetical protein [Nocardiopsis sp. LOL_012]